MSLRGTPALWAFKRDRPDSRPLGWRFGRQRAPLRARGGGAHRAAKTTKEMQATVDETRARLTRLQRALALAEAVHTARWCTCCAGAGARQAIAAWSSTERAAAPRPPCVRVARVALPGTSWHFVVGFKSIADRANAIALFQRQRLESLRRFVQIKDACTHTPCRVTTRTSYRSRD